MRQFFPFSSILWPPPFAVERRRRPLAAGRRRRPPASDYVSLLARTSSTDVLLPELTSQKRYNGESKLSSPDESSCLRNLAALASRRPIIL